MKTGTVRSNPFWMSTTVSGTFLSPLVPKLANFFFARPEEKFSNIFFQLILQEMFFGMKIFARFFLKTVENAKKAVTLLPRWLESQKGESDA